MKICGYRIAAALAVIASILGYFALRPVPPPVGVHVEAQPAPALAKVETEKVEVAPPITVYKPAAKKKLNLPKQISEAPNQHVVASTKVGGDDRSHTVTTVMDSSTGEFTTLDRADPLPWVAVKSRTEVGAYYGIKGGRDTVRIQARHEFLQMKSLHAGVQASADFSGGDVDSFVGVGVSVRW